MKETRLVIILKLLIDVIEPNIFMFYQICNTITEGIKLATQDSKVKKCKANFYAELK